MREVCANFHVSAVEIQKSDMFHICAYMVLFAKGIVKGFFTNLSSSEPKSEISMKAIFAYNFEFG